MMVRYTIRRDDLMKLQYRTYVRKITGTAKQKRKLTTLLAVLHKAQQQ